MLDFLGNSWGTILTGVIVAGIVAAIVVKMVRDKRRGKSVVCGCGCKTCPKAGACHIKQGG